jgi:chromosome partitioning protein
METYALLNQKGGTGKTTSVVSLGTIWAEEGSSVLVIDLDPQASLSRWLARPDRLCADYLRGEITVGDAAVTTDVPDLDLVPSDRSLASLEDFRTGKLVRRLENLFNAAERRYDVCLIDPPPSTGGLVMTAILGSGAVVAPVQAAKGALDGLTDTMQLIRQVGGNFQGAFACQVDIRTINDRQVPDLLLDELGAADEGGNAYRSFIRETVQVKEAEADGKPPPLYAPDSTATNDYQDLAHEIIPTEVAA